MRAGRSRRADTRPRWEAARDELGAHGSLFVSGSDLANEWWRTLVGALLAAPLMCLSAVAISCCPAKAGEGPDSAETSTARIGALTPVFDTWTALGLLRVRVVDQSSRPVCGAKVAIFGDFPAGHLKTLVWLGETGDDGRAAWRLELPYYPGGHSNPWIAREWMGLLRVYAVSGDRAGVSRCTCVGPWGEPAPLDVVLGESTGFRATFLTAGGEPVPARRIDVYIGNPEDGLIRVPIAPDATGGCELRLPLRVVSGRIDVIVRLALPERPSNKHLSIPAARFTLVPGDLTAVQLLTIGEDTIVRGRVIRPDGRAVSQARVRAVWRDVSIAGLPPPVGYGNGFWRGSPEAECSEWRGAALFAEATADEEGRFLLDRVPASGTDLWIADAYVADVNQDAAPVGYQRFVLLESRPPDVDLGDMTIAAGAPLSGRVVPGTCGEPKEVVVAVRQRNAAATERVWTDSEGRFEVPTIGGGPFDLIVGYTRTRFRVEPTFETRVEGGVSDVVPECGPVVVQAHGVPELELRPVSAKSGESLSGCPYYVEMWSPRFPRLHAYAHEKKRDVGRSAIRLKLLPAGEYRLFLVIPGFAPVVLEEVRLEGAKTVRAISLRRH